MQDIKTVILCSELRAYIEQKRKEQRELEERYNPYHDPRNGRFTNSAGGGMGGMLVVPKGQKGKGYIAQLNKGLSDEDIDDLYEKHVASQATNSGNGLTNDVQSGIVLPVESRDYGDCSGLIRTCKKKHVEDNPVKPLENELTEQEIIDRIGGADKTKGSCASLAFAYAANKAGYDVLDYRGGKSLDVFADSDSFDKLSKADNSKWIHNYASSGADKMKFLKSLPDNKEYIFSTGKHSAIVKQVNGTVYYLELQDGKKNNGWAKMRNSFDMGFRFGDISTTGYFAISVEDLAKSNGFKEMCGFINTQSDKQKKGKGGYAK